AIGVEAHAHSDHIAYARELILAHVFRDDDTNTDAADAAWRRKHLLRALAVLVLDFSRRRERSAASGGRILNGIDRLHRRRRRLRGGLALQRFPAAYHCPNLGTLALHRHYVLIRAADLLEIEGCIDAHDGAT